MDRISHFSPEDTKWKGLEHSLEHSEGWRIGAMMAFFGISHHTRTGPDVVFSTYS